MPQNFDMYCNNMKSADIADLITKKSDLKSIQISYCKDFDDIIIGNLPELMQLEKIHLSLCKLKSTNLIAFLKKVPNLKIIKINRLNDIEDIITTDLPEFI